MEAFESRNLSAIFRITLDPGKTTDAHGHRLVFLSELRQELEEAGEPVRLSAGTLDSAILEAGSKLPHDKALLDYLLPCWKRTTRTMKGLKGYASQKDVILKEAKRLCMSNCIFALTMPELFGREPNFNHDSLTPYLLLDPEDERGICYDFLTEAEARFEEDESIRPTITKAVAGLSQKLSGLSMNDDYKPYITALKNLTRFKTFTIAIAQDPLFQMAVSAPNIEKSTILGPFFRISPLQAVVTKSYFAGPKTMDKGHIRSSQNALRLTLATHQRDLLEITNSFIKTDVVSRNRLLDWFAYIINANKKRRAMQPDEKQVSTDGFMMNITVTLDSLCEGWMDATFSRVSKIDVGYLRRKPRLDIRDETKINADQTTSDTFYETQLEGTNNFISESFFLTLAAHHYGSEGTTAKLKNLDKDIKYFEKQLGLMEAERYKFASVSIYIMRQDAQR